jgi:spermidine synthase
LGYTAQEALRHETVKSVIVVEALDAVISWHEQGLLPLGRVLTSDPRCRFARDDFFALAASATGFDALAPARKFDAVLVDIDHSPELLLNPNSAGFYTTSGLSALAAHILPGGVFGLWSNDLPSEEFTARLTGVFTEARAERITFYNPLQNRDFTQTIYLARKPLA